MIRARHRGYWRWYPPVRFERYWTGTSSCYLWWSSNRQDKGDRVTSLKIQGRKRMTNIASPSPPPVKSVKAIVNFFCAVSPSMLAPDMLTVLPVFSTNTAAKTIAACSSLETVYKLNRVWDLISQLLLFYSFQMQNAKWKCVSSLALMTRFHLSTRMKITPASSRM